ncbi:MAG: VOC family protein [Deltaproteobacteria bacterium]|nr:VOC family protein [Deltaproteobacteria bacterium]
MARNMTQRGKVDLEGLHAPEVQAMKGIQPPADMPFRIGNMSHAVLVVRDIDASVRFYTQVLGFKVSDVYPESMVPGRMVFMRFNEDHHGLGVIGQAEDTSEGRELHHLAFEVPTLDDVFRARDHLEKHGVPIDFHGRRRAGCQVSVEFRDPDGHSLEIFWGLDQVDWEGEARPPEEWAPRPSLEEALNEAPPGQDTTLADPDLQRK